MKLEEAAAQFGTTVPEKCPALRRIHLALRRGKIKTLEQLEEIYGKNPADLLSLRGIGPRSLELIRELLTFFEEAEKIHRAGVTEK